jgi:primosomal protein N'
MAQDLTVNIKTTSDVPQAMDKAKQATTGFGKQVEDIQKKFSTSFKDIFLGFAAPMVILQGTISAISGAIEDARRKAQEGLDLMAKGDSMFVSSHEKRMAAFFKERQEREKESQSAKDGRAEVTKQFLLQTEEGKKLRKELISENLGNYLINPLFTTNMSKQEDVQKRAFDIWSQSPEGKAAAQWEDTQRKQKEAAERIKKEEDEAKAKSVTAATGQKPTIPSSISGNVIGVGQNPVVTALQEQQVIAREQLACLQTIAANNNGAAVDPNLTNKGATPPTPANTSPSRARLLTK